MAHEIVLKALLVVIIVLCTLILQGLTILYTHTKDWKLLSVMLIPFAFDISYVWIGIYNPTLESSRNVIRMVVVFSSCIALHVIWSQISKIKAGKNKESVRNNAT